MSNIISKQVSAPEDNEVNLVALLGQLLGHKWLVLIITSLVLTLGIIYASRQIPQYQSELLLQVEAKHSAFAQSGVFSSSGDSAPTQMALIQSRFILEPVIKSLGLNTSVSVKQTSLWKRLLSFNKATVRVKLFEVPQNKINQSFDFVFDKPAHFSLYDANRDLLLQGAVGSLVTDKSQTISLYVDAINAPIGTHFSLVKRSYTAVMASLLSKLKVKESNPGTGILDVSLMGPDPKKVVQILNAIGKSAQAKDAQKKSQEASQTLKFLYRQLPLTKGLLEKSEAALINYRSKSGKIDSKLQTQFLLQQLLAIDKQLGELRNKKINKLQKYTLSHPVLLALNTQVNTLKAERDQLDHQVRTLPASDQITVNLLRDVGVKKTLYLLLLNKIQELEVVKAGTVSSIRILAYATLSDGPLPGKQLLIYLASLIAGLLLSIMVIFGRKFLSPRVDDPHWSERHFNLANLAIIPYCKEQAINSANFRDHTSKQVALLAHANPRNLSIESLRSLRTSLQVMLPCARNNIISILGVAPAVGKSFVSSNLAYLLATGGKRVLLIDGDLRRGTNHKYFNTIATPGIADVLNNKATIEQAVRESMHPNLAFLPRGTYPTDPSELLMSDQFKDLIKSLSGEYDIVVIDTAPVLLVTDAVVIGALSATNFLVIGAGAHQPAEIEMVLKRLSGSEVPVHGTIFNFHRAATITQTYGSYGKYGKYHTYYYDDTAEK